MEDVYRCSGGGGTGLEGIEPKDRQMFHFANYFFFSWWGAVVAGPITIVVLIINQILVIFHRRVCMVSIFIFLVSSSEVCVLYNGMQLHINHCKDSCYLLKTDNCSHSTVVCVTQCYCSRLNQLFPDTLCHYLFCCCLWRHSAC